MLHTTQKRFGLAVALVALLGFLSAASAASNKADTDGRPVTYGEIEIEGFIPEKLPRRYLLEPDIETYYELHQRLQKAAADDTLDGVILRIRPFDAGWGKVEGLRDHIIRLRREGKRVICFLESTGNREYYLGSAADQVVMMPGASLMLTGLRAEVLFLKGLMDKIGVDAQLLQVGKYKGAAEPYRRKEASSAFRKSISGLLDGLYGNMIAGIARLRELKKEKVRSLIDGGPYTPEGARKAGLLDGVKHFRELTNSLEEQTSGRFQLREEYAHKRAKPPSISGPQALYKMFMGQRQKGGEKEDKDRAVAIIYALGPIVRREPGDLAIGEYVTSAAVLRKVVGRVLDREEIKAAVVRVDSPGGSSLASEIIWSELRRLNKSKPVIASMADTAASGGYYIASAARTIYARPGTITGSIGVVGGKFVVKDLYRKLGLNVEAFDRGAHAGLLSSAKPFSESERDRMEKLLHHTYRTFLERVGAARRMEVEAVREVAAGRVWTGGQAKKRGLVDKLGGLRDAVLAAKKAAGIPADKKVELLKYPRPRSIVDMLMGGGARTSSGTPRSLWPLAELPLGLERLKKCLAMLECFRGQPTAYVMPALVRVQ